MFKQIRQFVSRNLLNIPGFRTNRKIIVIESDDWGSIRMPSKEVYESLLNKGIRVDKLSFNRYDSLASEEDLSALFDILIQFKDKNGHHPIITANCVVANPDFDKIRKSNFNEYHYEVFTETLKRYSHHAESFQLWKEGMRTGIFHPQFHGREHVNVSRWMNSLKNNVGDVRLAFDYEMYDMSTSGRIISENSFMDSFSYSDDHEFETVKNSIVEGTQIFEDLFGYRNRSVIAPCYIWDSNLEAILKESGINFIQGGFFQKCPIPDHLNHYKNKLHFLGQRNKLNQRFIVRNCYFEPSETGSAGLIEDCLMRIKTAFRWNKPAIISTHRMNYIGYIVPENRETNLKLLKQLLERIITNYPDVEFMTSDHLGDLMTNNL